MSWPANSRVMTWSRISLSERPVPSSSLASTRSPRTSVRSGFGLILRAAISRSTISSSTLRDSRSLRQGVPRPAEHAHPGIRAVPVERPLEVVRRRGARVAVVGVEAEERPHGDPHREVPCPVVDVDDLAGPPRVKRLTGLGHHRLDRRLDPLAVERRHHDPPRSVVVGVVDGQEAVAEERDEVAEAALAPVEVVRVRDRDVVVRLGPEHEDVPHVEEPHAEDRPVLLVEGEHQPQRVAHEVARADQVEVLRPRREPFRVPALAPEVRGDPPERVGGELLGGLDRQLPGS